MSEAVIEIEGLRKYFGTHAALDGLDPSGRPRERRRSVRAVYAVAAGDTQPAVCSPDRDRPARDDGGFDVTSPQIPWAAIATACALALLSFGAALMVIQKRDY